MKAALLILLCSQNGYWIAGQDGRVTVQWIEGTDPVAAVWQWQLQYESVVLLDGKLEVNAEQLSQLKLTVPKVRTRTKMQLHWLLKSTDNDETLERGVIDINVFPNDPLADVAPALSDRRIAPGLPTKK